MRPTWLWLEVGFGSGEHALAQIAAHKRTGLIACEVFENGIAALLSRLVPEGADPSTAPLLGNLRIWPGDARALIRVMPADCLDGLVLLFPDPWPKARHAKRRFVHPALLPTIARAMQEGAEWRIATDDPTYQTWVEGVMGAQELFTPDGVFDTRPEGWPPTRYEAKSIAAGRVPRWWRFRRNATPVSEASSPRLTFVATIGKQGH